MGEYCRFVCTLPRLEKFDLKQNENSLQFRMNISVVGKQDFNNQISLMMPVFINIYPLPKSFTDLTETLCSLIQCFVAFAD